MGTDEDDSGVASGVGVGLGEGVARVLPLRARILHVLYTLGLTGVQIA